MDIWDQEFEYEQFLRWAFGLEKGEPIHRYSDPAGAANAEVFSADNLEVVKASVAYAMMIYRKTILQKADIPESEKQRLSNYIIQVINAEILNDISDLITGFNDSIVDRYFHREDGRVSFKGCDI